MPDSFGARLRQRREERQIDLIAISEQTKIKLALLESLERDDVSHWPSGIFRRAYIRAYAQMIGLDPDVVVREFLEVHPDPGDAFVITAAAAAAAEEASAKNTAPSVRLRTIVDSAIGSLNKLRRPAGSEDSANMAAARVVSAEPTIPATPHHQSEGAPHTASAQVPAAPDQPAPAEAEIDLAEPAVVVNSEAPARAHESPGSFDARTATEEIARASISPTPPVARRRRYPDVPAETAETAARMESDKPAAVADALQAAHESTLETIAHLCTELGRVVERSDVQQLLQESAKALTATGLIVWLWDDIAEALMPALVHGYSEKVLAHVPAVKRDADNATAAAFRNSSPCEVAATTHTSGAVVVPMLTPGGCAGVLALELQAGAQPSRSLRAVATVLAAALTQLVYRSRPAQHPPQVDRSEPSVAQFKPSAHPVKLRR